MSEEETLHDTDAAAAPHDGAPEDDIPDEDAEFEPDEISDEPDEVDARLIELVGFLVQGIVAHPEEVEVEEYLDDVGIVYGVRVHPDDVGRVIGKEGRVASALRQVVKAAATKANRHVMVEIVTDDEPLRVVGSDE
jgi:predicted RNA-binding protein YlqC (UPF0109 family)